MAQSVRIDGIIWYIDDRRGVQPLCPVHHLRLTYFSYTTSRLLVCADCTSPHHIPRPYAEEAQYILDKIDSKIFKGMKVINLDDEAIPLAEAKTKSKDDKHFVTALLTESKVGLRLVVYAGEKGAQGKTQIFVEPEIRRLAFDQKDIHPADVFVKLEATFNDGTNASIERK